MAWPTTTDPREVFVTTRFTKGEAADLDVIAAVHGDRSTAIRTAIEREARRIKRAQRKTSQKVVDAAEHQRRQAEEA